MVNNHTKKLDSSKRNGADSRQDRFLTYARITFKSESHRPLGTAIYFMICVLGRRSRVWEWVGGCAYVNDTKRYEEMISVS